MLAEAPISASRQALLTSGVQVGFVLGALLFSVLGLPDRVHPARLFAACAAAAALVNASLLISPIGGNAAIAARVVTGARRIAHDAPTADMTDESRRDARVRL